MNKHTCADTTSRKFSAAPYRDLKNCGKDFFLAGDDLQLRRRDLMSLMSVLSVLCEVVWHEINREGEV